MTQMDNNQAAELLEAWIQFYDMDDPQAWEPGDYPYVKNACKSMRFAIQALRGNTSGGNAQLNEAATHLEQFPEVHGMDDPDEWEKENLPFVNHTLEAIRFTADFLRKQQAERSS
jgi:hypothetical protein